MECWLNMETQELLSIMQSDMKLWDKASTEEVGPGKVVKTLDLPYGIGEYSVTLEGLNDADKRRSALASYGAHIRQIVKERIDDEAVTARAKAAAARSEQVDSGDSILVDPQGVPVAQRKTPPVQGTSGAHEEDAEEDGDLGEALAAKGTALRERIGRAEDNLAKWKKELAMIEAALDV